MRVEDMQHLQSGKDTGAVDVRGDAEGMNSIGEVAES